MTNDNLINLITEAKKQNPDAFTKLMQHYMKDMYRVASAILMNDEDAADAIQDTILTCWEKLYTLKEDRYFKTWMTRVLINHCYAIRKKQSKYTGLEAGPEPAGEDVYNVEFKEALSGLEEPYRLVMILFYCEGYSIKEIAGMLKISKSAVQTRLFRGRKQIAAYYKES